MTIDHDSPRKPASCPGKARTEWHAGRLAILLSVVLIVVCGVQLTTTRDSNATAAWARKYNADCAMCHYPVIPRLNSFGQQFRRAGYRTPSEFNKDQDVTKVGDFLAVRVRARWDYNNTEGSQERNEFRLNDVTIFYGGAISRNFSAFASDRIESDGSTELVGQIQGVYGTADRYISFRTGQMNTLPGVGVGGLDRPVLIQDNPLFTNTLTKDGTTIKGVNYKLNTKEKGLELAYVQGRARLLGQILDGVDQNGSGTATKTDTNPDKDFLVAYEHILDDVASGFTLFYYNGTTQQMATSTAKTTKYSFSRLGVYANKVFPVSGLGFFELQGGYVRSYDNVYRSVGPDVEGNAYYVESQQYFTDHEVTFVERFSLIDFDAPRPNTTQKAYTFGIVTPVQTWFRLTGDYTYTDDRATGLAGHLVSIELQANW